MEVREVCAQVERDNARLAEVVRKLDEAFNESFEDALPHKLPKVAMPTEPEQLTAYGALYKALLTWLTTGASCPFDWDTMGSVMGNLPVIPAAKVMLGEFWGRWYSADPAGSAVVPRQVATLVFHGLNSIRLEYENEEMEQAVDKRANEGYEAIKASAKRLRTEAS